MRDDEPIVAPDAGELVWLMGLGARYVIAGERTGDRLSIVEHPIKPKSLASPMHTHTNEDEISYVIEGRVGVQIGDRVVVAGPGTTVFKPRGIPHAFWNDGEEQARVLEVITPAGFEQYFREMAALYAASDTGMPDPQQAGALLAKYSLQMELESIPRLIQAHNLRG